MTGVVLEIHSEVFMSKMRPCLMLALKHTSKINAGEETLNSGAQVTLDLGDGCVDVISTILQ